MMARLLIFFAFWGLIGGGAMLALQKFNWLRAK